MHVGSKNAPETGMPTEQDEVYVKAEVQNHGEDKANDAQVDFFWSIPGTGFNRIDLNKNTPVNTYKGGYLGTDELNVPTEGSRKAVCPNPWIPSYMNQGHLCLVAQAYHVVDDPHPNTVNFNTPTDRHVAQRNLGVKKLAQAKSWFSYPFAIYNPTGEAEKFTITARQVKFDHLGDANALLGDNASLPAQGDVTDLGFTETSTPTPEDFEDAGRPSRNVQLDVGAQTGLTLVGRLDGEGALITVTQELNDDIVSGLSLLLMREKA